MLKREKELASGCDNSRTPWATIGQNPSQFFDICCLPEGFAFQDPSRMGANVKNLLGHLRERQEELGVNSFQFHHILRNNKLEPAAYPAAAQAIIDLGADVKNWPGEKNDTSEDLSPADDPVVKNKKKAVVRKSKKKRKAEEMEGKEESEMGMDAPVPAVCQPAIGETMEVAGESSTSGAAAPVPPNPTNIPTNYMPTHGYQMGMPMQHYPPFQQFPWVQLPVGYPHADIANGQNGGHNAPKGQQIPPPTHYPFGFNPQYYHWNQMRSDGLPGAMESNDRARMDPSFHNIDPSLLPPGPPIFGTIPHMSMDANTSTTQATGCNTPLVTCTSPTWTASTSSPCKKRTPKKRKIIEDVTPSRSNRTRTPSRKVLESADNC
jgi:hypothetical protein